MKRFFGILSTLTLILSLGFTIYSMPLSAAGPMPVLSVAQPFRENVRTEGGGFNIFGTSNPSKELYVNGRPVTNRTAEGFFSVFVPLVSGVNVFTFSQEGQADIVRTITRETAETPPHPTMRTAALTNVFPVVNEYVSAGDIVNFSATAPVGAAVTVRFNGAVISLEPEHRFTNPANGRIYSTTFTAAYFIPQTISAEPVADLGRPVYFMEFDGAAFTATGANIRLISENAPFYATVRVESAWAFPGPGLAGGPVWNLLKGQKAAVRAVTSGGDWVRLDSGLWIQGENADLSLEPQGERITSALKDGRYIREEFRDRIVWRASHYPAVRVDFDGEQLRVYFALQTLPPSLDLSGAWPSDTFFSEMRSGIYNGIPFYTFAVKDTVNIEGFYVSFSDGEFTLNIRRRRALSRSSKPLSGFSFVIDAGHGLQDYGALGPMGRNFAEKHINLLIAGKLSDGLSRLGAEVVMVRDSDVFFTLQERTDISRRAKPDMFISIHANSTAETTDAANIHGISFWYRNPNSRPLAQHLTYELHEINPLTTRHTRANRANFFVCRPLWTPSVIVEASFMNNIHDFAWMINPANRRMLANGLVSSILSYYGLEAREAYACF